jgi:hypothetical protein
MRIEFVVVAVLAASLLFGDPASADSARSILEKLGLFGTWAADCTKPASMNNPHGVYRAVDGDRVQRETSVEPGKIFDVSISESVADAGGDDLIIAWRTGEGVITNRIRVRSGQMQVMDSTRANGEKLAANRRRLRDNTETTRFRRCDLPGLARSRCFLHCGGPNLKQASSLL